MNAIEIRNLYMKQGTFEVKIDELDIPQGYITGLIGENGAGKTSLIYQLLNLKEPQSGDIKILGKSYNNARAEILSDIGVVFSENHFPEWQTPKKLEKLFQMYYSQWDHELFMKYLTQFELPYNQKIKSFSQGMKVKLNLATALSHHAKLLILDEPTSNLDPTFRLELLRIFQELMLNEQHTILFSTHITSDLESVADFVAFIERGELRLMEEKEQLISSYQIVKGTDQLLDDELDELLIGLEVKEDSFTGMTTEGQVFKELFGEKVYCRRVTLDELMYFMKKERVQKKVMK
ncbi:ABC transporter ATP-binding protein [Macrococcus brunensis]|uniref:ABC transporter ATP-binding protein n=1 Tax=Macrococcus brunensis TaxID=198483 RepID=UPI001EF125FC|nr:ABC transporter ATP-binding protein [Macrococcus brunensis]ULG72293.1 ABC transporter ATP-binding protein [Macrococcus brunensis]